MVTKLPDTNDYAGHENYRYDNSDQTIAIKNEETEHPKTNAGNIQYKNSVALTQPACQQLMVDVLSVSVEQGPLTQEPPGHSQYNVQYRQAECNNWQKNGNCSRRLL